MSGVRAVAGRRWGLLALGGVGAAAVVFAMLQLQSGQAAAEAVPSATVTRGDLVVSVGGVGRIVQSRGVGEISVPGSSGGSGSSGSGSSGSGSSGASVSASGDGVFARTPGRLTRFLVSPGQRVKAGQAVAVLDDGGATAVAAKLAQVDLDTALLELRQKRTSDPLKGVRATPVELRAGQAAVVSAKAKLARLFGPPRQADVALARFDVKKAKADLETLLGGSPAVRADAIRLAQRNVQLAEQRLQRAQQPISPADITAAEAELKRVESELAVLQRPPIAPAPETLVTAQQQISFARHDLLLAMQAQDIEAIRAAQDRLDSLLGDLYVLLKPGPGALPAQVAAAQAAIESARKKLEKLLEPPAAADVTAARLELERAQADLRTRRAGPSATAVAAARQAVTSAEARLAQLLGPPLRADVTLAQLDVRRAEADLALLRARGGPASSSDIGLAQLKVRAAQARMASAQFATTLLTVRVPWGGTVTNLLTVRGAPVDTTTPIVTVADLSRLSATVDLSEFDAALVKRGLKATVGVDALGGKAYAGKVRFAALTGTNTGGLVIFPVQVGLTRTQGLKPGMNVSVRIIVAQRRNVLQVPLEAVSRDDEDRPIVEVLDASGEPVTRRVKLGLANNQKVEIVSGLKVGERVALAETVAPEEEA